MTTIATASLRLPDGTRHDGGRDEHEDHEVRELAQEHREDAATAAFRDHVGAEFFSQPGGLLLADAPRRIAAERTRDVVAVYRMPLPRRFFCRDPLMR